MKWNKVQLMLHYENIAANSFELIPYAGVKLSKVNKAENPNYVFLDFEISPIAKPGKLQLRYNLPDGRVRKIEFELKARRTGNGTSFAQGVTSKDLVYLLMPDRFSNGDPTNDRIAGMRDQTLNRDSFITVMAAICRVINHLDYLKDLGVTSVG
jgi:hypothetical protein